MAQSQNWILNGSKTIPEHTQLDNSLKSTRIYLF